MKASPMLSSMSPSFNSCSHNKLAEIAARVIEELKAQNELNETESEFFVDDYGDDISCFLSGVSLNDEEECQNKKEIESDEEQLNHDDDDGDDDDDDDDDFEFAFVTRETESSPISADEIFSNGEILPVYPIFNRDLLLGDVDTNSTSRNSEMVRPLPESIRLPLRKLIIDDREETSSSSSLSKSDGVEPIPSGTFCVWRAKSSAAAAAEGESSGWCKKSNSTGTLKRWRFRDLIHHRSSSDGKDTFVFYTPQLKKTDEKVNKTTSGAAAAKVAGKVKGVAGGERFPAMHYAKKGGDIRRKSYLPYRQDIVGFFASTHGLSRTVQRF